MPTQIKEKEIDIQNALCEYLEVKGYVFWRQNNLPVFNAKTNTYRSMPKYSIKGVSDIIVLVDSIAWFLEVKTQKGVQSPTQKEFEEKVKLGGCQYRIVRGIDDLQKLGF